MCVEVKPVKAHAIGKPKARHTCRHTVYFKIAIAHMSQLEFVWDRDKFDKSGDGSLDSKELRDCIRMDFKIPTNKVADNDIDLLVRALDDDGSGTLSITELVDFVEHVRVLILKNTFGPTA